MNKVKFIPEKFLVSQEAISLSIVLKVRKYARGLPGPGLGSRPVPGPTRQMTDDFSDGPGRAGKREMSF